MLLMNSDKPKLIMKIQGTTFWEKECINNKDKGI